ncbi:hypothetical protein ACM0P6_04195 [Komagataeibacter sucrofermentans]|uniref:Abi-alpha family protein n=1 Tax=Komagataeibacter sucrofermentans TaxID=1053551 RepID=UPI0011B6B4BD|nr:hypothetical protein [Komagataeibacter sucrofermentans]GBQ51583.1 hypothetical protein AA15973_2440 [Komagataeibacter sucrofermentans DSM 15973]
MYVGDPIKAARQKKNLERIAFMVKDIVGNRTLDENMSQTVAESVLEAAKDQDREPLQAIWASLLARIALGQAKNIRIDYFETLKKFEPIDAITFEVLSKQALVGRVFPVDMNGWKSVIDDIRHKAEVDQDDVYISLEALVQMDCAQRHPSHSLPMIGISRRGGKIYQAIQPPQA